MYCSVPDVVVVISLLSLVVMEKVINITVNCIHAKMNTNGLIQMTTTNKFHKINILSYYNTCCLVYLSVCTGVCVCVHACMCECLRVCGHLQVCASGAQLTAVKIICSIRRNRNLTTIIVKINKEESIVQ